jgi:hypothetical protein
MEPLFTRFVRSLEGAPDERLALDAWNGLREILKGELKRRGLWLSPPSYLGIHGAPGWSGETGAEALKELVAECYAFIFVDRLGRLQAQLKVKPNIEGLILLNVRHFFLERQKAHDPLGYRVYEMVQAAVLQAIDGGELFVLSGDEQVRNPTVLGFAPGDPEGDAPTRPLGPLVARWNDELLPGLVLARGRRQEEVWARIRGLIRQLELQGVRRFRFRDVLDPLKSDTRRRWAALLEGGDEVGPRAVGAPRTEGAVRRTQPETAVESRQSLEKLTRYVSAAVARMPMDPRTRDYLAILWHYLRMQAGSDAASPLELAVEPAPSEPAAAEAGPEGPLSHRRLAQLLGIPRERLPGLFAMLRQMAGRAQARARGGSRSRWEEAG